MSAVVDSSVLVAALTDGGPHGEWAEEILTTGPLYAPELALVEATNILRRLELAKVLSTLEADLAQADLMRLELELLRFEPFADRIWSLRRNLTGYDAWYVAAAEALGLPLATLDARMSKAAGTRCRFTTPPPR